MSTLGSTDEILRSALDSIADGVVGFDSTRRLVAANRAARRLLGDGEGSLEGVSYEALFPDVPWGQAGPAEQSVETSVRREDGTRFRAWIRASTHELAGEKAVIVLVRETGDEKALARRLADTEERLALAQQVARMGYWDWDPVAGTVECSDELYRIFGLTLPAMGGKPYEAFQGVHPDDLEAVQEAIKVGLETRRPYEVQHRVVHPDGGVHAVVARGAATYGVDGEPVRVFGISYDVTDRWRLENQLRQSQKLEAIGSLAGGVAHDFNNLLAVIRGYSGILAPRLTDEKSRRAVERIDGAAARAAELTGQLLAFGRQQVLQPKVSDLNTVVEETMALLERMLGEDIVLETRLDPELAATLIDPGQIGQVILNLAINAREAMPQGGMLTIQTETVELDETYAASHAEVSAGQFVLMQITDTGTGMDEPTRERVFDPFFTTKDDGTGLGLSTVYGIVKQSGGHIWLYSEPGIGTTFKIYFPATDLDLEGAARPVPMEAIDGHETILVVEDADELRALVVEVLESYGYTVLAAADGPEALELAAQATTPRIELLLTDVVMPHMNGRELAQTLQASRPHLKVLYTSGYPSTTITRHGIGESNASFIQKPYLAAELARKIRELLEAPPS